MLIQLLASRTKLRRTKSWNLWFFPTLKIIQGTNIPKMNNSNSCLKSAKIKLTTCWKRETKLPLKPRKNCKLKPNSCPTGNSTRISSRKSPKDSRKNIAPSLFTKILCSTGRFLEGNGWWKMRDPTKAKAKTTLGTTMTRGRGWCTSSACSISRSTRKILCSGIARRSKTGRNLPTKWRVTLRRREKKRKNLKRKGRLQD